MVFRPLAFILAAGFTCALASGQSAKALDSAPSTPDTQPKALTPEMRGDIFMARKQYREAIDTFREGPPRDPVLWNKIGIAYHQMQQLDNAKKSYEQALRFKPDYAEAMNNIGTVYYSRKSFRRAISWYQRAIKTAPTASFYSNLGTAYFSRKQYEQATAAYKTALELNPNVFEERSSYGTTLQERTVEERAKYHYFVAKLYAKAGRNDLALQYIRKAIEEGFKERKKLEEDPEFAALRDLPEFKALLTLEPRVL
ncbi:MAG: tetratricopeptide repeat protein [Acidobacteriia bacterium]|nr:tetratricopeptide repeat protein [Terriglobia bacterium]